MNLNLDHLKQDVQRLIDEGYKTPTISNHGIANLITRIEQAEHRVKRYKALAETRLETIQRVRDLHQRFERHTGQIVCIECNGDGDNGDHGIWPCPTIQALEGDQT